MEGTGLGLEIVEKLCQTLGHKLDIQSKVGLGTRVAITIPAASVNKAETKTAPKLKTTNTNMISEKSILIVEVNDINLEIAKNMIIDEVAAVHCALNGQEAIDMIKTNAIDYDVVLMDLNMPIKDGYAAAIEINSMEHLKIKPRIIALSADAYEDTEVRCAKAGMSQHLAKPFTKDLLIKTVARPNFNVL